jgi:hypothetical protein
MKKVVKLTERELNNLIRRMINEDMESSLESKGGKWLSVKNKIPANPPKMSLGALKERLGNDGYSNDNSDEPLANIQVFVHGAKNPGENIPMRLLFRNPTDPTDRKWYELVA